VASETICGKDRPDAGSRHGTWATRGYPYGTGSRPNTRSKTAAGSKCWLRHAKPSTERKHSEAKLSATARS
jgi:hypothetical protein